MRRRNLPERRHCEGGAPAMSGWRKSSHSMHNGQCPEAGHAAGVAVRDSRDPARVLVIPAAAWRAFTRQVSGP